MNEEIKFAEDKMTEKCLKCDHGFWHFEKTDILCCELEECKFKPIIKK